ncbi:MAG: hypothetical protein OSJ72_17020 [Lachnospiraceae bacterium]|nr:hypothetical protein [Lachnospiraceae bacterium]
MTREQANKEYRQLLHDWNEESDSIIERAKREGRLKPGLDSNRELFVETDQKYMKKIQELKDSVDE